MDPNLLLASFFFGMIGLGMFMYGKKAGRMMPLCAGLALMIIPYFVTNLAALITVECAVTAASWFARER